MEKRWSEKSKVEKVFSALAMVGYVLTTVFLILSYLRESRDMKVALEISFAAANLLEAVSLWNDQRKVSILCVVIAAISVADIFFNFIYVK